MADPKIYDLSVSNQALDSEEGLKTAITISLLSDARARPDDVLADPTDLRGFWGDSYAEVPGDTWGSRLWTLHGKPITADLIEAAREMCVEALQWMVEDGLIGEVEVEVAQIQHGVLGATIGIFPPNGGPVQVLGLWEISLNAV